MDHTQIFLVALLASFSVIIFPYLFVSHTDGDIIYMIMEEHEIYNSILENIPVGFSIVDREGKFIEFNAAAEKISGYAKSEVIGMSSF